MIKKKVKNQWKLSKKFTKFFEKFRKMLKVVSKFNKNHWKSFEILIKIWKKMYRRKKILPKITKKYANIHLKCENNWENVENWLKIYLKSLKIDNFIKIF